MKKINEIKKIISKQKHFLKSKFQVKSISVFGSYVKSEQNSSSDIDILVEFSKTIDLIEFIELENYLSDILGSKVDLVMKSALKSRIKDNVLREAIPI
jgi:predicted nucleotidyltransferase